MESAKQTTLKILSCSYQEHLAVYYPANEINSMFERCAEKFLNATSLMIHSKLDVAVNKEQEALFSVALDRLINQEPIQYILGDTSFYNALIIVDKGVLIPRQETEELVQMIIQNNNLNAPRILDIGTGSGAIAIALKQEIKDATLTAYDFSEPALEVARANAQLNKVNVRFELFDILKKQNENAFISRNRPFRHSSDPKTPKKRVVELSLSN